MLKHWFTTLAVAATLMATAGCDTTTDPNDPNGTQVDDNCGFGFTDSGGGKDYGESCTANAECRYGVCLAGGAGGNVVSTTFGYCTRGCDCGTNSTKLTDTEKLDYLCMYPPGNEGQWRHVVPKCDNVSFCSGIDAKWTKCAYPGTGATNVCME